ncbi:MAG: hypothetical protein EOM50_14990 [Erysipelotrichia bacterium]|nr:hypothetical protein [Erysipelotrichia bacterium]
MKYMLAVDGYTMSNGDGFNSQAYFLENNTLGVLKDKKDDVKVCNLENYVGGGESVDYDLLGIKDNVSVLYIKEEKKGLKINILASLEKNADIESVREILNNEFKKLRNEYEVEVLISADLAIFDSLEALEKSIAENDFARRVFDGEDSILELEEYFKDLRGDEADKMKFSTVAEGLAKIKDEYINGEVTEGEFADYLVLNYDKCFDSSVEPVVAIRAIQEFRQWDYEMEGEDAIETFGGTEALSDNGYYGFIFMRNGQSMQLPDGVRVGIQTEDGGIALDEGITACFKETKCFNANDYTTRQLIEMEFEDLPDSEHKDNMIDEALQLVEECGYTVGEAANTILSEKKGM